jgi:RNA polymerase sigma-70 factor, ECF subfamily
MNDDESPITVKDLQNLIGELRMMARRLLYAERKPQSITPTALAMSALRRAKLHDQEWDHVRWENRSHFFAVLVMAMRHALIDRARAANAIKQPKIDYLPYDDPLVVNLPTPGVAQSVMLIALDEALARLKIEEHRARQLAEQKALSDGTGKPKPEQAYSELIELHYFMGYTTREVATYLAVDEKTVDRRLDRARVILERFIKDALAQL